MATNKATTEELKNKIQAKEQATGRPVPAPNNPYRTVEAYLQKLAPEISKALPKHLSVDRMTRITLTTIKLNPALLEAPIESLLGAVFQASQLGLEPNLMGSCYFIPYKNYKTGETTVSFQIGYRGLIDLASRSGELMTIKANAVHEKDEFHYEYGLNEDLKHVPAKGDRGEVIYYYAYAKLKNGGYAFEVMSMNEIHRIRDAFSQAWQGASKYNKQASSVWGLHFDAMAKKTVIKQLLKYLPISVELQNEIAHDGTVRKDITSEAEYIDIENLEEITPIVSTGDTLQQEETPE